MPGEERRFTPVFLLSAAARNLPWEKTNPEPLEILQLFLGRSCTHAVFPISSEKEPSLSFLAAKLTLYKAAAIVLGTAWCDWS